MKKISVKRGIGVLLTAILVLGTWGMQAKAEVIESSAYTASLPKAASGGVALSSEVFKDENVLKAVKEYDADGDGYLSKAEISSIERIDISELVTDVSGLEKLTSLHSLELTNYANASVSLGKSVNYFYVQVNNEESITIDAPGAVYITVGYSWVDNEGAKNCGTIDVSRCSNLKSLTSRTELSALKLPKEGGKIRELKICSSRFKNLVVPTMKKLTDLSISSNDELISVDLKNVKQLKKLTIIDNPKLSRVNLSKNKDLTSLICAETVIEQLDISKNKKLEFISCPNNALTSLDCSKNTKLTAVQCYNNKITSLKVTKATKVKEVSCENNNIKSLNLSKNSKLETVNCYGNPLKKLYIKGTKNVLSKVSVTPQIKSAKSEEPYKVTVELQSKNKGYKYWVLAKDENGKLHSKCALDDKNSSGELNIYDTDFQYTIEVAGGKKYKNVMVYAKSVIYKDKVTVKGYD
ncbi:MAG: hypothetical protein NC489_25060 [Ruminococcus flavefaciens]|nr:hypothetical protein [Ruminococcus flavefaciens]